VNLVPFITGEAAGVPHETMFWRSGSYKVVLAGDWKLQVSANPAKEWLFNLKDDPTEQKNLADIDPAKRARMRAILDRLDAEQATPIWPSLVEGFIPVDRPLGRPAPDAEEHIYWSN
jgi:arylsulfatase A-like enzyme